MTCRARSATPIAERPTQLVDPSDPGIWDRHALRYGAQERLERRALSAALRLVAATAQDVVIDLGTGTGAVMQALAACDPRPAVAIGVDRSAGMLARVGELPVGWSAMLADARDTKLEDAVADVVVCSYLLHVLAAEDRAAVLAEARRLLAPRPASRLVIVTVWADRRRLGGRLADGTLRALARARPAAWGALAPLDPTDELRAAGFIPARRVVLPRGGYPSLVIVAHPRLS